MTVEELKTAFVYAYKREADAVYFAPGRINLISEYIAKSENAVLPATLSFGIYYCFAKTIINASNFGH